MKTPFVRKSMKKIVWILQCLFGLLVALRITACSSEGATDEEPVPSTPLPTPTLSITVETTEATVRWSSVENVMQYEWELQQDALAVKTGKQRVTSYTFALEEGASYRFRVRALARENSGNTDSEWSEYVEASSNMLTAPLPKVVETSITASEATIRWEAIEGAGNYRYELALGAEKEVVDSDEISDCEVHFTSLQEGSAYTFRVMALAASKEYNNSSWSSSLYFETRSICRLDLPKPRLAALSVTGATLCWEAVDGAQKYGYELVEEATGELAQAETIEALTITFEGLREMTSYIFRVQALADDEDPSLSDSDFSEPIVFTTRTSSGVDVGLPLSGESDGLIRAFPGAEGGGMYTTGGRGGKVYHVTTLEDNGEAGSLRWALNQSGPRTIVFDVAGTIRLKSVLNIKKGDVTIAGQTAPGDGICLRDYSVQINANNIIIRYLRFRMGDESKQENDAIWGRYYENIILDHCSMSWATDECASFYANRNFTMQWCLIGESLRTSVHTKGNHGYGGIWGGKNASFHHNLLTCHDSRNCRIDHPQIYDNYVTTHRGNVDLRNNVIYNWGSNVTYGGESGWFNLVGNYYKPGPASSDRKYFVAADAYYEKDGVVWSSAYPELYLSGNVHTKYEDISQENKRGVNWTDGSNYAHFGEVLSAPLSIRKDDQTLCYTTTHDAEEAFDRVLGYCGASLQRDAVDDRLVYDARTGTATYTDGGNGSRNGIIDTQSAVGGWPLLSATEEEVIRASVDSDGDGIPDFYESLLNLDAFNADDAAAKTLDPLGLYSNLEVYLHFLVKEISQAQVRGGQYESLD